MNNDKNFTAVTEFIKRQTNLRTLGVELYGPINQPTTFFDKITKNSNLISIESLSVILNGQQKSKYPARMWDFVKLCEFIRSQPKLKTLEIRSKIVPQSVLETIQQCCRVKKLMLDIKEVTPLSLRDPDSAEIRPNIFLKSLILMRPIKPGTLIDICSMFPNIEILSLVERRDEINEHLLNISNHLKSLRVLKLSVVGAEAPEVSIPSLQSLYVDDVDSIDGLQKFLNCNTSISDLVLRILFKDVKIDPEKIALLTKGLVNLQSFVIDEQSFKPTVSMLNKIHANCPKLKTLVVCNHDHRHVASPDVLDKVYNHPHIRVNRYAQKYYYVMKNELCSIWNCDKDLIIPDDTKSIEDDDSDDGEDSDGGDDDDADSYETDSEDEEMVRRAFGGNIAGMMGFMFMDYLMNAGQESSSESDLD